MTVNFSKFSSLTNKVIDEVERAVVGKRPLLEKIMAAILVSGGHLLLEDYPGLGKTLIANSFARSLGLDFRRIQFTPDLLPGDITGGYIFNRSKNSFELHKGPIFANIILADEINRASPKTQSALLEAMQEQQVTLEGETMRLPEPFIVIATQNPLEYEGTFPLPEAQLDRFIMKLSVGYPTEDVEQAIIRRRHKRKQDTFDLERVATADALLEMRREVEKVHIDPALDAYIVAIITKTRRNRQLTVGASPRGSLALLLLSRAWAALQERDYVIPDDIKHFVIPALQHRLILDSDLWLTQGASAEIITKIINGTPVPVVEESANGRRF